jgi:hypothetical protein
MGSAYLAMADSHISDFDEETQSEYSAKARELFTLSLKDKAALAKASALGYEPLIQEGEDSRLYQHDMLSLLTRFVLQNAQMKESEEAQLLGEVAAYYKQNGPRDAYALTQLEYLYKQRQHEDYNLRMPSEAFVEALKTLVEETKDIEAGADVAQAYCKQIYNDDERLTFARWAQTIQGLTHRALLHQRRRRVDEPHLHPRCSIRHSPQPSLRYRTTLQEPDPGHG